ncbi:unnamed protein product, partial [Ectocarpus sp. 12 AP-2014]
ARVGGGGAGFAEATPALAPTAAALGANGSAPLSEEQPNSSPGSLSPTPPSTREPSPPPLSTQEGSVASAATDGNNCGDDYYDSRRDVGDRNDGGGRGRKRKEREQKTAAAGGSGVTGGVAVGNFVRGVCGTAARTEGASNDGRSAMFVSGVGSASGFVSGVPGEAVQDGGGAQASVAVAAALGKRACSAEKPLKLRQRQQASEASRAEEVAGMQERGRKSGGVEEKEHED